LRTSAFCDTEQQQQKCFSLVLGSIKLQRCRGSLTVAQTKGLLTPPLDSFGYGYQNVFSFEQVIGIKLTHPTKVLSILRFPKGF
jgi:hypothetical protein